MSFFPEGTRGPATPFFRCVADKTRPLLYRDALTDLRWALVKSGSTQEYADKRGLHSLRVLGYNCAAVGEDETTAGIHGGWKSDAKDRYARVDSSVLRRLYNSMVSAFWTGPATVPTAPAAAAPAAAVPIIAPTQPTVVPAPATVPAKFSCVPAVGFPDGWALRSSTNAAGRLTKHYIGPDGGRYRSRKTALAASGAPTTTPSDFSPSPVRDAPLRRSTPADYQARLDRHPRLARELGL